jgi:NAD(P)-dependent dehydrogenase (short-subunit alcohol dehydrogenase family)
MRINMKRLLIAATLLASFTAASIASAATVLVTGSNRGIGLEFVRQYAADGWTVIATARDIEDAKELKALAAKHKNITLKQLDIINDDSVKKLAADLKGAPIDVLINNAGVLGDIPSQTFGGYKYSVFQQVMGVNAFGALAVSEALHENVAASQQKKIIAITSGAGIISGKGAGGPLSFYRQSKVALNMGMRGIANDLRDKGVIVGVIAPGAVDTAMRREIVGEAAINDQRPEASVSSMRKVIDGLTMARSGLPLNYDGKEMPW